MSESTDGRAELLRPYLPRLLVTWPNEDAGALVREIEGTVVFVDISGFTKMSERLARHGKVGAEEVTEVLGSVFARLLALAYQNGGSLLKFGGDALLLFFQGEDHQLRGARAAHGMRAELRSAGKIETTAGLVTLRMSVGVNSGLFHFFLVGDSHHELIITGPVASHTVLMENTASAGEILIGLSTALALPPSCLGAQKGEGLLLRRAPTDPVTIPAESIYRGEAEAMASYVPVAVRDHLLEGRSEPQHRSVTVAFLHFEDIDEMLLHHDPEITAFALDELVRIVQGAADRNGGHVPGQRRRSRRRQDHPDLRRARRAWRRRGADAAHGPRDRRREADDPAADRRQQGPGLRGRRGAALPADLHGDGRRREPGGARDDEGRAGRGPGHGARARGLPRRLRDGVAWSPSW